MKFVILTILISCFISCGNNIEISLNYQGNFRMTKHFSVGREWPVKEDDGLIITKNTFQIFKPPLDLGVIYPNKVFESPKSLICEYVTKDDNENDVFSTIEFLREGENLKVNWAEGTYEFER